MPAKCSPSAGKNIKTLEQLVHDITICCRVTRLDKKREGEKKK